MKKRLPLIAMILSLIMVVTACYVTPPQNEVPHFSERKYVKIEASQFVTLIDEATSLSQSEGNGAKVVAKMQEVERLFAKLSDAKTLSNIYYSQDVTTDVWAKEMDYCANTSREVYNLVRECEKKLFTSAVKDAMISAYGKEYVDSVLIEILPTSEQLELFAEESRLSNQHAGLLNAKKYAEIEALYINLVKVRKKIATSYGYDNFSAYSYAENFYRDYSPDEASLLAEEIKQYVAPIVRVVNSTGNRNLMYMTELSETTLMSTLQKVASGIGNKKIVENYNYLIKYGLYDVKVSDKKEGTAYCIDFAEFGDSFLFLDADGHYGDLSTMVHEFGHFSETLSSDDSKATESGVNYELAESHSQGMEVLSMPVLEKLLDADLYKSYLLNYFSSSVNVLSMQVLFDEFEQKVYALTEEELDNPNIVSRINGFYKGLAAEYGYSEGSIGDYFFVPHFFFTGLYCISYAVSLMVALQLGSTDFGAKSAVDVYIDLLSYGMRNPLSATVRKVGLASPFDEGTVFNTAKYLVENLNEAGLTCPMPVAVL